MEDSRQDLVEEFQVELVERVGQTRLIARGLCAQGLLSTDECTRITSSSSSQERMRMLFKCLASRGQQGRDALYRLLQEHEPELTLEMECAQFVKQHRVEFIKRVKRVEQMANRLVTQNVLSDETYFEVCSHRRSEDRMKAIYRALDQVGAREKNAFYRALLHCEPLLYRQLETERVLMTCGGNGEKGRLQRQGDEEMRKEENLEARRRELRSKERSIDQEKEELKRQWEDLEQSKAMLGKEKEDLASQRNHLEKALEQLREAGLFNPIGKQG